MKVRTKSRTKNKENEGRRNDIEGTKVIIRGGSVCWRRYLEYKRVQRWEGGVEKWDGGKKAGLGRMGDGVCNNRTKPDQLLSSTTKANNQPNNRQIIGQNRCNYLPKHRRHQLQRQVRWEVEMDKGAEEEEERNNKDEKGSQSTFQSLGLQLTHSTQVHTARRAQED